MGHHFSENIKLTVKLFALIWPIVLYGSEIWGIDCNGKLKSQKIKNFLYHVGLGILWEKAHLSDVGNVSIIRQILEDIELQRWFSEMNNVIRKDPNQSNKM